MDYLGELAVNEATDSLAKFNLARPPFMLRVFRAADAKLASSLLGSIQVRRRIRQTGTRTAVAQLVKADCGSRADSAPALFPAGPRTAENSNRVGHSFPRLSSATTSNPIDWSPCRLSSVGRAPAL